MRTDEFPFYMLPNGNTIKIPAGNYLLERPDNEVGKCFKDIDALINSRALEEFNCPVAVSVLDHDKILNTMFVFNKFHFEYFLRKFKYFTIKDIQHAAAILDFGQLGKEIKDLVDEKCGWMKSASKDSKTEYYSTLYICPDGDACSLEVDTEEKSMKLNCFTGMPMDGGIILDEQIMSGFKEYDGKGSFEINCFKIANYYCETLGIGKK